MPNRVQWSPGYSMGNDILDTQHRQLLAQCSVLADCIAAGGQDSDLKFRAIFDALMAQAGEHFATEETLLAECGYPMLEELKNERDEFDYLANDIITTENFEPTELQRFLVLWWVGHIVGSGKKCRAFLEKLPKF